jgi:CheY-like chemotaxis protein
MRGQRIVLVIDDNEDEILLMERLLLRVSPDLRIEKAMSGEEGIARLKSGMSLPVLTLLDLKMVGIDGVETLRRIRADDKLMHLSIVVITNSTLESDRKEAMDAGADAFLHKSFDIDDCRNDIQLLLNRFSNNNGSEE